MVISYSFQGIIYVNSRGQNVYALDAKTGKKI
ncbi:MAG: hypothetical protein ACE5R6_07845 [Candidatus Heimdallarchaeota archaeon]